MGGQLLASQDGLGSMVLVSMKVIYIKIPFYKFIHFRTLWSRYNIVGVWCKTKVLASRLAEFSVRFPSYLSLPTVLTIVRLP
jgi:hypothetical protein